MKLNLFLSTILAAILSLSVTACGSDSEPQPGEPQEKTTRSVIVYMAANNNLSYNASADILEMKSAAADIKGGRLIVYCHLPDAEPRLFEITPDGKEVSLRTYDKSTSSVTISQMKAVISDVKTAAPADNYGLILWSHGTGWLSDNGSIDERNAKPLSFGADGKPAKKMKITSLAKALEGSRFDFIYFDCCHMATVEVAYELRGLTDFIVASPTELPVDGMPYHRNLQYFFAESLDLPSAIKSTYESYISGDPGCAISLIRTGQLDNLAAATRNALRSATPRDGYRPVPYFRKSIIPTGIFDMWDYYTDLLAGTSALEAWQRAFNSVVTDFHTTPKVFALDASRFKGLGCHILSDEYTPEMLGYDETKWYNDVLK